MIAPTADPAVSHPSQPAANRLIPAHLRRIVLTGFMGAGKTTVGRLLAGRLGWEFLDLDACIESRAGLTVPSIFAAHGEAHFRQLESQALAASLGRSNVVLALGGGAPESLTNRLLIEQTPATATVFLDAPFATLIDRCVTQSVDAKSIAPPAQARRPGLCRSPLPRPPAHLPPPRALHHLDRLAHHRRDCRRAAHPPANNAAGPEYQQTLTCGRPPQLRPRALAPGLLGSQRQVALDPQV